MGSILRVTSEHAEAGYLPHPFDHALREGRFRRSLPKAVAAFVRSADRAERAEESAFTDGALVLEALRRLETFEREDCAERCASAGIPVHTSDLVFLRTARRARVHEARVRTAFGPARTWSDRIAGPITAEDPWRDLPEGESRSWVLRVLGAVEARTDGVIVRPGHAVRERPTGPFETRFESKEQPIELHFLPASEHPDWRALLTFLEANPTQRFRFAAW